MAVKTQNTTKKKAVSKTHKSDVKLSTVRAGSKELPHFTHKGEKITPIVLGKESIQTVSPRLVAQVARVYQSELHQGTKSTKTRGEVTGSTRKIFRQKGTGRARHGSIKAPIFVGGGIAFGPKPHDPALNLSKKMRRNALTGLFSEKVKQSQVSVVSGLGNMSGKTKDMAQLLRKMDLLGKRLLLVVTSDMKQAYLSARNLEKVVVRPMTSVSPFDLLRNSNIIFAREAFDMFLKRLGKKI